MRRCAWNRGTGHASYLLSAQVPWLVQKHLTYNIGSECFLRIYMCRQKHACLRHTARKSPRKHSPLLLD